MTYLYLHEKGRLLLKRPLSKSFGEYLPRIYTPVGGQPLVFSLYSNCCLRLLHCSGSLPRMVNMLLVNSNVDYYRTDKFDLSCGVGTAQQPPHLSNEYVEAVSTLAAQPWTTFFTITQKPRSARGGHGGARISDDFHMLKAVKTIFKFHTSPLEWLLTQRRRLSWLHASINKRKE